MDIHDDERLRQALGLLPVPDHGRDYRKRREAALAAAAPLTALGKRRRRPISRRMLIIAAAAAVCLAAAVLGVVLTARLGTAKASAVFVDAVPTTLPAQGVRIDPVANVLLMPTSVEPGTLGVSSAAAAIAAAPQNAIPKTAYAVLADVTVGNGKPDPGLDSRLAWVVTYQWNDSQQIPWIATPMRAQSETPQAHYAHGQVSILDAQTGEFLLGFFLMDPFTPSPLPSPS